VPGPAVRDPDESDPKRRGAAPGTLGPASADAVRREFDRARSLGAKIEWGQSSGQSQPDRRSDGSSGNDARMRRQFRELVEYTQRLVRESAAERDAYWSKADFSSPEHWVQSTKPYRDRIWD